MDRRRSLSLEITSAPSTSPRITSIRRWVANLQVIKPPEFGGSRLLLRAEELHRAHGCEPGVQQAAKAGGVARGHGGQDQFAGGNQVQGVADQGLASAGSPFLGVQFETEFAQAAEALGHDDNTVGRRLGIAENPWTRTNRGRVLGAGVVGEVGAGDEGCPSIAVAPADHDGVEAVDPTVRPGEGGDQAWVVGATETVHAEVDQGAVQHVVGQGQDRVPGERHDRLEPGSPGRNSMPASVDVREVPGRGRTNQLGQGVVNGHARR